MTTPKPETAQGGIPSHGLPVVAKPEPETDALVWECGPHKNAWGGHDARCRQVSAPKPEKAAKCPRCKSEMLSVGETHEEHGTTLPGRVLIKDGFVLPPGDFYFEPGDSIRVCSASGVVEKPFKTDSANEDAKHQKTCTGSVSTHVAVAT